MTVLTDLAKFGTSDLAEAGKLLTTLNTHQDDTKHLGDGVYVCLNTNSGFVFLSDEDYNVAMMSGHQLVDFHNCPNCGNEALAPYFRSEFADSECCQEYADDLELEPLEA